VSLCTFPYIQFKTSIYYRFLKYLLAMASNSLLHKKSLCVITGASRGIGKEMAVRLSSNVAQNSKFLLLSRSEDDLLATAEEIRKNKVAAEIFLCDLTKLAEGDTLLNFENKLAAIVKNGSPFDVAFDVHNAGDMGDVSKPVRKFENVCEIREHLERNVVSYVLLNNVFLRVVGEKDAKQRVVINITSQMAKKSLAGFGLYAIGKAGREGYARSLAVEETDLRVLNYAPGPVKTKLTAYVEEASCDEFRRKWWTNAVATGGALTVEQTTTKFLRILDENTFQNGAHVDYYDLPDL